MQVTATRDQAAAAKASLARYGSAVTLALVDEAPELFTRPMEGGDGINSYSCSAGFNLRNPSTGKGYLLTGGHCVDSGDTLKGHGLVNFGPVLETRNDNASYWTQGPWVDIDRENGDKVIETHGYTDAPVGTIMCQSGKSTGSRCGLITAKDVTSGGRSRKNNGWPRCLEVFGEENESFYFPIANSLAYYGPRYGVVLW